jgi:hypothetical protein
MRLQDEDLIANVRGLEIKSDTARGTSIKSKTSASISQSMDAAEFEEFLRLRKRQAASRPRGRPKNLVT